MNINWYPGHMAKTKRLILENLSLCDIVIELVDARIPLSSKNPDIDNIVANKKRLLIINKCDLSDKKTNEKWVLWFKKQGIFAILTDSITGNGINLVYSAVKSILSEKIKKDNEKGIKRSIKMMIVGIPNVGKSSFINKIAGRASAKTGDRPGVTKGKQWIRLQNGFEMIDTPGILWPKLDDVEASKRLAFTGAIKDDIMDIEGLCFYLIDYLKENYKALIENRYKIEINKEDSASEIIEKIAIKRGAIISGGNIDLPRISAIILDEFRGGKIGKISLEEPQDRVQ